MQTLLRRHGESARGQQQRDPRRSNEMQLRAELQADRLAGVWANRSIKIKQPQQPSEIESVMREPPPVYYDAALEKWALGRRMGESITKGEPPQGDVIDRAALVNSTSAQRVRSFTAGFQSGRCRCAIRSARRAYSTRGPPDAPEAASLRSGWRLALGSLQLDHFRRRPARNGFDMIGPTLPCITKQRGYDREIVMAFGRAVADTRAQSQRVADTLSSALRPWGEYKTPTFSVLLLIATRWCEVDSSYRVQNGVTP